MRRETRAIAASDDTRRNNRLSTRGGEAVEAFAMLGLAVTVAVVFSVLPKTGAVFFSVGNFQALAGGQAVLVVATLAILVPLICDEFDLSVGANLGLAGILSASVMSSGAPLLLGVVVAIASGVAVGVVNGLLVTRAHVNAVVVTLGVASILSGIVQAKTHGISITTGIPNSLLNFGSNTFLDVPWILIAALLAAAALYYLLEHTPFGRQLYMLGANRNAARLVGLRTDRLLFLTFVIAGALAGLGGIMEVGYAGSAVPIVGPTFTLPAFAAAFLSAAAIKPGRFNVWGAVVAISFLAIINGGLNLAGAQNYVSDIVNGTALIIGVGLAVWLKRRRQFVAQRRAKASARRASTPDDADTSTSVPGGAS